MEVRMPELASCRVLLADPPWPFKDRLSGAHRGAAKNYKLLSINDLCAFPLPILAGDAWLFLWRVSSMVEEAYAVARAWGFEPKAEIVWVKQTTSGKLHFGMGRYVRATHETCIIARRGKVHPVERNVRSVFFASTGLHSEKPEAFYEILTWLCGPPPAVANGSFVELFARRERAGWISHGDELPGE